MKSFILLILFPAAIFSAGTSFAQNKVSLQSTSGWIKHDLSVITPGLSFLLPAGYKIYAYEEGVTIFVLDEEVLHSIKLENSYESLNMKEEREWLEESEDRENLVWLIDEENMAYYTGTDLSAPEGHQKTHSGYAKKVINGKTFFMNVDGISIDEFGEVYQMDQKTLLMLLTSFDSLAIE